MEAERAALRLASELPIDMSDRSSSTGKRFTHGTIGEAVAEADIHGRSHPYRVSSMTLFVYGSCELLSMRLRVTCIDCAEILPIEHCHGPGSPPSDSRAALPPAAVEIGRASCRERVCQ